MTGNLTPIDEAFERCRLLASLVDLEYRRARANPNDKRYVELGILAQGMEKRNALKRIESTFDDLAALVEHLAILDMAAGLEKLFRLRIATAVGEARKTLREKFGESTLARRERLVREADDFQGFKEIIQFLSSDLSAETQQILDKVRENRNRFAHGTNIRNPSTIPKEEARTALNYVVDLLKPV